MRKTSRTMLPFGYILYESMTFHELWYMAKYVNVFFTIFFSSLLFLAFIFVILLVRYVVNCDVTRQRNFFFTLSFIFIQVHFSFRIVICFFFLLFLARNVMFVSISLTCLIYTSKLTHIYNTLFAFFFALLMTEKNGGN